MAKRGGEVITCLASLLRVLRDCSTLCDNGTNSTVSVTTPAVLVAQHGGQLLS